MDNMRQKYLPNIQMYMLMEVDFPLLHRLHLVMVGLTVHPSIPLSLEESASHILGAVSPLA